MAEIAQILVVLFDPLSWIIWGGIALLALRSSPPRYWLLVAAVAVGFGYSIFFPSAMKAYRFSPSNLNPDPEFSSQQVALERVQRNRFFLHYSRYFATVQSDSDVAQVGAAIQDYERNCRILVGPVIDLERQCDQASTLAHIGGGALQMMLAACGLFVWRRRREEIDRRWRNERNPN